MTRILFALVTGYISITFLNSFTHLIVAIYSQTSLFLNGVSQLPSLLWVIVITTLQFLWGLFAGFITTTLARKQSSTAVVGLLLLVVAVSFINYYMLGQREPIWYLITAPVLKMAGIYLGYTIQYNQMKQSDNRKSSVRNST